MKNIFLFFILFFVSSSFYGQSQQGLGEPIQILPQAKVEATTHEIIKGEIPEDFSARQMVEMLELNLVYTAQGKMHETFLQRPDIIIDAILLDEEKYKLFKNYLTATKESQHSFFEQTLLELY